MHFSSKCYHFTAVKKYCNRKVLLDAGVKCVEIPSSRERLSIPGNTVGVSPHREPIYGSPLPIVETPTQNVTLQPQLQSQTTD